MVDDGERYSAIHGCHTSVIVDHDLDWRLTAWYAIVRIYGIYNTTNLGDRRSCYSGNDERASERQCCTYARTNKNSND